MNDDKNMPNQTANKSKAEGERWQSEPDTVEQRDRSGEDQTTGSEGGGITNRPLDEERESQRHVPERGSTREEE